MKNLIQPFSLQRGKTYSFFKLFTFKYFYIFIFQIFFFAFIQFTVCFCFSFQTSFILFILLDPYVSCILFCHFLIYLLSLLAYWLLCPIDPLFFHFLIDLKRNRQHSLEFCLQTCKACFQNNSTSSLNLLKNDNIFSKRIGHFICYF